MTTMSWMSGVSVLCPESLFITTSSDGKVRSVPAIKPAVIERLQVWSKDDRLLGYLDALPDQFYWDSYSEIPVERKKRAAELERCKIATGGPDVLELFFDDHHVPDEAVETMCHDTDSVRYVWNTIVVDIDAYERLFDLDEFLPL